MIGSAVPIPRHWYNAAADLPELYGPYIDPATGRELTADSLTELFAPELVEQELDRSTRLRPIPDEVMERYALWRPTPLIRATGLERALGTKCKIFYKYEGVSPIGSHKANSGVAQAHYSKRAGRTKVYAETGAGQWGSAISMGSSFVGLDAEVFMVGGSYDAKPSRRILMETFGSTVHRSPSPHTAVGRAARAADENAQGSLGLAIGEAVEAARADPAAAYALGSAFNFVCLHQTVIGQELRAQLDSVGLKPDALISCIGGGSSFAGLVFPFLDQLDRKGAPLDLVAVESNAVPKVTQGKFTFDHGDSAKLTPLVEMYTLGHEFAAPGIHSGGLRYHGLSGQVSKALNLGMGRAVAYSQLEIFKAASLFARTEGLIPAPEAAHSVAATIEIARQHRDEEKVLVFCLTGHGFFDLSAYQRYNLGQMEDSDSPSEAIARSLGELPKVPHRGAPAPAGADPFDAWERWHFGNRATPDRPVGGGGATDLREYRVVSERLVREACRNASGDLFVAANAVITPAAESEARDRGRAIVRDIAR
ncbi:TrpB-like pyridoxal phosphate-dependent enzyme [Actinoplanes sp. NPDC023801]|uniref:TrpB-like pyridoxal phosphate-dependent enzyme n=1 Tax=Actinoplanes sp. NPDC023801 TaxID=3154595 RepID=UPI0033F6136B